jgi:hypothetical protein
VDGFGSKKIECSYYITTESVPLVCVHVRILFRIFALRKTLVFVRLDIENNFR